MRKQYKMVVEQKVVDDTYYVRRFIWTIVDEENNVYETGEEDTRELAFEKARKKYKKFIKE